ncbi:MAG TPA: HupE/UreJ family protein [Alphaproteobacteria bacterium]
MRLMTVGMTAGAIVMAAGTAQAHTLGVPGNGLAAGFAHPFGGLDHVLAMVAVGLWAVQLGGRAVWQVPATFVAVMAAGALAGMSGLAPPSAEVGIAASLLVLGALIAAAARLPATLGAALVAIFALFHGHAHGLEMPATAAAGLYGLGFALATAGLHGIGIGLGLCLRGTAAQWTVRVGGAGIAAAGLAMLVVV